MKHEPINFGNAVNNNARQKQLFEEIHEKYYAASGDEISQNYKRHYVYETVETMLDGATSVLELASGTGATVGWLRERNPALEITGCDISEKACADFQVLHGRPCFVADLLKPFDTNETYDVLIVMGGVHHLVADLPMAFRNIHALLKPGGRLIMAEPNSDYVLEPLRKLWYALDTSNFDAANEHALSHGKLFKDHGAGFKVVEQQYFGGIAYYLLTLNWVLRMPNSWKKRIAPFLMQVEKLYHKLPGRMPYASFIACWEKR